MGDAERIGYEQQLRAAVLAGDEAAWRAWYDAAAPVVARYVHWRTAGLNHLAEDVLQDTWMTAVRKISTFDPKAGAFRHWVCGVAANVIRNHLRKHVRTSRHHHTLAGREIAAPSANGDDKALRTAAALAALSPRYESALRSKYLEGKCVADIAAQWGETPKALESVLTRAREAFRAAFEGTSASDE